MTVDADRRVCTDHRAGVRIDVFLEMLAAGATISPTEVARLICDRSCRLAAHILGRESVAASPSLSDEALQELERELGHTDAANLGTQLCDVIAKRVWTELNALLRRQPEVSPNDAGNPVSGFRTTVVTSELATDDSTLNPGLLDTWNDMQQGLARLEPDLRQMIDLVYFAGVPIPTAATLLSIPAATAQARWRVAKIRLAMAGANLLSDGR